MRAVSSGDEHTTETDGDVADGHPNVLVVITAAQRRGAEIEGTQLAARLGAQGWPSRVVALSPGHGSPLDVEVLGRTPTSPSTLRALRRAGRAVDVVVGYGSSTLPACALALAGTGTPFIYRSIGDPAAWVRGGIHRRRTGLLFGRAAAVAALSESSSSAIGSLYGVPAPRLSVIPNARGTDDFRPPTEAERAAARDRWRIDDTDRVAVAVGALSAEKQTWLAARAVATIDDLTLLVAGDGPEHHRVEFESEQAPPGKIRLLGEIDDPLSLFHAADVLVLSSRTEGMPGVVIEAGLCGVPTVATRVGMLADLVVDGRSGILLDGFDATTFADATRRVLLDRERFGERALEHARSRFTWDSVIPRWLAMLERVDGSSAR